MSELTPCNFCSLNGIKARAAARSDEVVLELDHEGWTIVYVNGKRIASMQRVTTVCVC